MCKLVAIDTNINTKVKVSEYKQNQILCIIKLAASCEEIEQIILFGSSLEEKCTERSDIDFVVISKHPVSVLSKKKSFREFLEHLYMNDDFESEYDILYFKSVEEISKNKEDRICAEINEKGKVIYEKRGAA